MAYLTRHSTLVMLNLFVILSREPLPEHCGLVFRQVHIIGFLRGTGHLHRVGCLLDYSTGYHTQNGATVISFVVNAYTKGNPQVWVFQ